jgi:sugar diacid utilization regulator
MTIVEHIKQLIAGLTTNEKQELAASLNEPQMAVEKAQSLRGDWRTGFTDGENLDEDLKEIRSNWQQEWRSEDFVG